jgi:hypothetical protein
MIIQNYQMMDMFFLKKIYHIENDKIHYF